jgi:hypothetical protein
MDNYLAGWPAVGHADALAMASFLVTCLCICSGAPMIQCNKGGSNISSAVCVSPFSLQNITAGSPARGCCQRSDKTIVCCRRTLNCAGTLGDEFACRAESLESALDQDAPGPSVGCAAPDVPKRLPIDIISMTPTLLLSTTVASAAFVLALLL